MTKAEIIIGESFFTSGNTVIGIAFEGDKNPIAFGKWAEGQKVGRPSTIHPLNGRTVESSLPRFIEGWKEWAERSGVELTIATNPRQVEAKF